MTQSFTKVLLTTFLVLLSWNAWAGIIYVSPTGNNSNGESWATAYTNLQPALDKAFATGEPQDIWMAVGTYKPTTIAISTPASFAANPRSVTFNIKSNVSIYGGFLGNENLLAERPAQSGLSGNGIYSMNYTVLSGDLMNNDLPTSPNPANIPCPASCAEQGIPDTSVEDAAYLASRQDNVFHVVTIEKGLNVSLDGLVVERGHAFSPTFSASLVEFNRKDAGIMILASASQPTVVNINSVEVRFNQAVDNAGIGGLTRNNVLFPTLPARPDSNSISMNITNSWFHDNIARSSTSITTGLGPTLIKDTKISNNLRTGGAGDNLTFATVGVAGDGDIYMDRGPVTLDNVLMTENKVITPATGFILQSGNGNAGTVVGENGANLTILNSRFINNVGGLAGVIDIRGERGIGTLKISGSEFTGNKTKGTLYNLASGGVVLGTSGVGGAIGIGRTLQATVEDSIITDNESVFGGAGITVANLRGTYPAVPILIRNVIFSKNKSESGAAIFINSLIPSSGNIIQIENCQFDHNTSSSYGGALAVSGVQSAFAGARASPVVVQNSTFSHNEALGNIPVAEDLFNFKLYGYHTQTVPVSGGAVFNSGTLELNNSTFNQNSGSTNGGAIANVAYQQLGPSGGLVPLPPPVTLNPIVKGLLAISDSQIVQNSSLINGGGIATIGLDSVIPETTLLNTNFIHNSAVAGGAISVENGLLNAISNFFNMNSASVSKTLCGSTLDNSNKVNKFSSSDISSTCGP